MNRYIICLLALPSLIIGCKQKNPEEELANKYLQKADSLYQAEQYKGSKAYIDSINTRCEKQVDIRQKADIILTHIKLIDQEKAMVTADSTIKAMRPEIVQMTRDFVLDKDSKYQDMGSYRYCSQSDEAVISKTLIKPMVDEDGNIVMESIYNGGAIHHTNIRFSCSGQTAASETVDPSEGNSFNTDGVTTETLTFHNVNELADLVRCNKGATIKVTLEGGRNISYTLSGDNKNAISKASELSILLKEKKKQNRIINIAKKKIQLYQSELAEHD